MRVKEGLKNTSRRSLFGSMSDGKQRSQEIFLYFKNAFSEGPEYNEIQYDMITSF